MPRRNKRVDTYVPLDVTPPKPRPRPASGSQPRSRAEIEAEWERRDRARQERAEIQAAARVDRAIDWSLCVVPGCGEELVYWGVMRHRKPERRDSRLELPICFDHAAVVWNQLVEFHTDRDEFIDAIVQVNAGIGARLAAEKQADKVDFLARQDGDIYFIKLNGLVKVGWSRDLYQRVRSYGASAELLVSYPATRDDETNLHRQLRPALAKGREWYEDGDVIQAFINEALSKYGAPTLEVVWTTPKTSNVKPKSMR